MTLTGLDCLCREGFDMLRGQRVGLIVNHTAITRERQHALDVLLAAGVEVVALFGPEHGLRGDHDETFRVRSGVDETTGLPVHSLFSDVQRPTGEMLKGLHTLVFDIQDVGVRYYTYTTTMAWCMEEAKARGIRFVVLDRPNPIGGEALDGPVLRESWGKLTTCHRVPIRHGLTAGELALFANEQNGIGADLHVVPCEGWRRDMWFDETGLPWVNPSPNLRSLTQATLYSAVAGIEAAAISVGRGTEQPFEVFGAPYVSGVELAERLNGAVPHLRFVPVEFTPNALKFAGQRCEGCFAFTTSRDGLRPAAACVEIALALTELYPEQFDIGPCRHLWGDDDTVSAIRAGDARERITAGWEESLAAYDARRKAYLLYR